MRDARVARAQELLTAQGELQPAHPHAAHSSADRATGARATGARWAGPALGREHEQEKGFLAPRRFSAGSWTSFPCFSPGISVSSSRTANERGSETKIRLAHTLYLLTSSFSLSNVHFTNSCCSCQTCAYIDFRPAARTLWVPEHPSMPLEPHANPAVACTASNVLSAASPYIHQGFG